MPNDKDKEQSKITLKDEKVISERGARPKKPVKTEENKVLEKERSKSKKKYVSTIRSKMQRQPAQNKNLHQHKLNKNKSNSSQRDEDQRKTSTNNVKETEEKEQILGKRPLGTATDTTEQNTLEDLLEYIKIKNDGDDDHGLTLSTLDMMRSYVIKTMPIDERCTKLLQHINQIYIKRLEKIQIEKLERTQEDLEEFKSFRTSEKVHVKAEHEDSVTSVDTSQQSNRKRDIIDDICDGVVQRLLASGQLQQPNRLIETSGLADELNAASNTQPGQVSSSSGLCCNCKTCKCPCHSNDQRAKKKKNTRRDKDQHKSCRYNPDPMHFRGDTREDVSKQGENGWKTKGLSYPHRSPFPVAQPTLTSGIRHENPSDDSDSEDDCKDHTKDSISGGKQDSEKPGLLDVPKNGRKNMRFSYTRRHPAARPTATGGIGPENPSDDSDSEDNSDSRDDSNDHSKDFRSGRKQYSEDRSYAIRKNSGVLDVPEGGSNTRKNENVSNLSGSPVDQPATGGIGPQDPSDNSDAEDDSKDHARNNRSGRNQYEENNSIDSSNWKIDIDVWKRCIEMEDVQEATRLVNNRILPDQHLLDRASEVFGTSSKVVKSICTAICSYIKKESLLIIRVWPALDYRQDFSSKQITFIIYTSRSFETETIEYRCYKRSLNEISTSCSDENTDIKEREQNCEKDYSEIEKIRKCLNKKSKSLMELHKNLTRASISWFKSEGYGTENQSITRKTCIALYVQVKGFVPLSERVFPKILDGIVVDVREGIVQSYIGPNEHNAHLKMGCAVHCGLKDNKGYLIGGTLGGFVEIETAVYCISSAHVFLSTEDMKKLKHLRTCDFKDETIKSFHARQPVCSGSKSFGIGVRAVYQEGGNGETGVEVVIIEVQDRLPISGDFPDCPYKRNPGYENPIFSSGKMCNREEVNSLIREKKLTVVKYGCSSGWTRGCIRFEGGSARLRHMVGTTESDTDEFGILVCDQYEIDSMGGICFAEGGDSGALVFTDACGPLSVIGIIEGGMSGVVYVTPIYEVFAALGLQDKVQNMKVFSQHIQNIPMQTVDTLSPQYLSNRNDSGVFLAEGNPLCNVEKKLGTLEQDLPQEIAMHAYAIKDEVNTIKQELDPVKAELCSLKSDVSVLKTDLVNIQSEVERSKTDLKHEIDKSKNELQSNMKTMQEKMDQQTDLLNKLFAHLSPPSPATNTSDDHPS